MALTLIIIAVVVIGLVIWYLAGKKKGPIVPAVPKKPEPPTPPPSPSPPSPPLPPTEPPGI